jgi:hypothetical protein
VACAVGTSVNPITKWQTQNMNLILEGTNSIFEELKYEKNQP